MADVPSPEKEEPAVTTVTEGHLEEEFHVDADSAGEFLIDLGEQFRGADEITINREDWEIPFSFGEPIELEIEFAGDGDPELEIEVELQGHTTDGAPGID